MALPDPWLGQQIGPYRIERLLGHGGMAVVYQTHHRYLGAPRALKLMAAHLTHLPEFVARFKREATLAASLKHPNVVTIHDSGEQDTWLYLAMELAEGGSLQERLRETGGAPWPLGAALALLGQVAAGLDYAHEQGLIHRDLKPANILIRPARSSQPEQYLLADFGIARAVVETMATTGTSLTGTGLVGTPPYMSPEQWRGEALDQRSDVYAFAVLAYQILVGRRPFDGEMHRVMYAHLMAPPPDPCQLNPFLSPALGAVMLWGLAKRPAERPARAGELVAALVAATTPAPRAAEPPDRGAGKTSQPPEAGSAPSPGPLEALPERTALAQEARSEAETAPEAAAWAPKLVAGRAAPIGTGPARLDSSAARLARSRRWLWWACGAGLLLLAGAGSLLKAVESFKLVPVIFGGETTFHFLGGRVGFGLLVGGCVALMGRSPSWEQSLAAIAAGLLGSLGGTWSYAALFGRAISSLTLWLCLGALAFSAVGMYGLYRLDRRASGMGVSFLGGWLGIWLFDAVVSFIMGKAVAFNGYGAVGTLVYQQRVLSRVVTWLGLGLVVGCLAALIGPRRTVGQRLASAGLGLLGGLIGGGGLILLAGADAGAQVYLNSAFLNLPRTIPPNTDIALSYLSALVVAALAVGGLRLLWRGKSQ